jgi:hypothetical protein
MLNGRDYDVRLFRGLSFFLKRQRLSAPRYLDPQCFLSAFTVEVLVQLQPQLTHMHAYGAVFRGAVIRTFSKDGLADSLFGQFGNVTANRVLRKIAQKITQAPRLPKRLTAKNALDKLPALVVLDIRDRRWGTCRRS